MDLSADFKKKYSKILSEKRGGGFWIWKHHIIKESLSLINENDLNNDPIETFAKMLSYNNFIVGNSTFSLIAAFIVESNSSIVVIADPWFREIMHPGFDFKNWIKIENK